MTKIEELKAAFEAVTPGEWEDWPSANGDDDPMPFRIDVLGAHPLGSLITAWVDNERDASFIALAHNLMPQLLEAVEVLKQIKALLDDHPQAAVGNTKVHVVVCKATGALNAFKEDFE